MADIRSPKVLRAEGEAPAPPRPDSSAKRIGIVSPWSGFERAPGRFPWRGLFVAIIVLAVFGGGFFLFSKYEAKKNLFDAAEQKLSDSGFGGNFGLSEAFKINSFKDIEKLWPLVKSGIGAYQSLGGIATAALSLSNDLAKLEGAATINLAGSGSGETLVALKAIQTDLRAVREASDGVDAKSPELKNLLPIPSEQYAELKYQLRFWEQTVGSLVDWLSSDRNAVIFLQNSSELRPTGGFWGSFAAVTINNGDIATATVRDINEADRTLKTKTVPPKPLQLLTTNWKTADSNWFFNFPDSAARAKNFLDSSALYQGKKVDLVSVVTPQVVSDLLALTGPLTASSSKVAIDKDNFLPSIQEEVQSGQSSGSSQAKKILKDLFPAILSKFLSLNDEQKGKLLQDFSDWAVNKDLVLWTEDRALQSAIEAQGAAGSVFQVPQKFNGDYLAVSAANVGGQKSDYVTSQKVVLESRINLDGTADNHLVVTRQHNGKKGDKWWYLAPNQAYLKVFVADPGFSPQGSGGLAKTVIAPIDYKKSGFTTDALISAIEGSAKLLKTLPNFTVFQESGKTAFATWVKTQPGKTSTITLDYNHRLFLAPAEGVVYQFVFDKQPGINGSYDFSFTAPVGFIWAESNSPVYEYKDTEILGRLNLSLTLKKAAE